MFAADPGQAEDVPIERGHPAFWWSRDGRSWTAAAVDPDNGGYLAAEVALISAYAGGFVAVGDTLHVSDDPTIDAAANPSCWMSSDGTHGEGGEPVAVVA
jgi:hypothetical protein